jgi:hypothetical protein
MSTTGKKARSPQSPLQAFAIAAALAGGVLAVCAMSANGGDIGVLALPAVQAAPTDVSDRQVDDLGRLDEQDAISQRATVTGPSISSDGLTWEFGEWEAGADLQHTFVLRNDGDTPLHIVRAKPG